MVDLLEPIFRSPRAAQLAERLRLALDDEHARRECWRDAKDEKEKAEWINGEPYVHSPVKLEHARATRLITQTIDTIVRTANLGEVGVEKLLVSLTRNDFEPDVCFWRREIADTFDPKQMTFPPPDLVVEVLSPSTEPFDRGVKFEDYAFHGVREYWIVDPAARTVEQYLLRGETFELRVKLDNGTLTTPTLSNTLIPVEALFDDGQNLALVKSLLAATDDATGRHGAIARPGVPE